MNYMLAFLGSLGTPEIIAILVVVFLLFGAKKLPELARGIGKSLGEFKKAKNEFETELMNSDQTKEQPKTPTVASTPIAPPNTAPYTQSEQTAPAPNSEDKPKV